MRKRVIFGRNKPYERVRCPFCKHTFAPETIQIVGITEEQTNFVILLCPSANAEQYWKLYRNII